MTLAPVPSPEETTRLYQTGGLAAELARFHEYPGDNDPFVAQCVELHNKGDIDLVVIPTAGPFKNIDGHSFFTAQHLYCEAIPKLKADVTALMECCSALVKQAGNDGAAGQPNRAFEQWCVANPDQAQSVVAQADTGDPLAKQFAPFALRSANDISTAVRFVQSYNDERRVGAMHALAHMRYADAASAYAVIDALLPFIGSGIDENVRLNALRAAFDILKAHPEQSIASALIQVAATDAGPSTLHALAEVIWLHHALLDDAALLQALTALQAVPRENLGTINILDSGLRHLLTTSRGDFALDFLTDLLRDPALTIENFDSIAHELRSSDPERLYRLIVRWFLSGSITLCNNVTELIGVDKERPFDTTVAPLGLTEVEQLFLCRKAIGFLFIKPVVCCSIIVSVLRAATSERAEEIAALLFDPVLLNYGGSAKDYLKSLAEDDTAHPYVEKALALDDAFHQGLDSVGVIKELHPSDYQRNAVWQRTRDEMRAVHKLAEQKSVLIHLVHRSTILYGKRSLTYISDPAGNRRAVSMDLKSFGTTIELPRHEILDPVGLDYMMRVFRVEKLK